MKKYSKIVSLLVLIAVLAATVAGAYFGIAGRNTQMVTVTENGQETQRALYRQVAFIPNTLNKSWHEAIIPSAQLGGGICYEFVLTNDGMDDAGFAKAVKATAEILRERAVLLMGDASVAFEGDTVYLTLPSEEMDSTVGNILATPGEMTFALYDDATGLFGDAILTKEHIKDTGYYTDGTAYYMQVMLNSKGQKALKTFLNDNAGAYLYALLDGGYIGYLNTSSTMDTSVLSVYADDWTYALTGAVSGMTDTLPAAATLNNAYAAEGKMEWVLDAFIIAMFIVTVLAALFMIIRGKVAGLVCTLTLCAQSVLFCLIMALISVEAAWKMTLSYMVILTACQLLFIGGLVFFNERLAAQKNRSINQAAAAAAKKSVKPLSIVFGALIVLGVILMMIFGIKPAAYLGRIVTVSGILSFAMIFVALRVLLACVNTLKNNK